MNHFFFLRAVGERVSERQRSKAISLFSFLCVLYASAVNAQTYSDTTFVGSVHTQGWSAISGISLSVTTGGYYTNATWQTNYYRLSGTNIAGRIPTSTNVFVAFCGSPSLSNAVQISWTRAAGLMRHVVEKSYDQGSSWTNWLTIGPGTNTFLDTGSNTWTAGAFTSAVPAIPAATYPWPSTSDTMAISNLAAAASAASGSNTAWLVALTPTTEVALATGIAASNLAAAASAASGSNTAWLGALTPSQQVDRAWLGALTPSQQVDRAIANAASNLAASASASAASNTPFRTNAILRDGTVEWAAMDKHGGYPIWGFNYLCSTSAVGAGRFMFGKSTFANILTNADDLSTGSGFFGMPGGLESPRIQAGWDGNNSETVGGIGSFFAGDWGQAVDIICASRGVAIFGTDHMLDPYYYGELTVTQSYGVVIGMMMGSKRVVVGPDAHGALLMGSTGFIDPIDESGTKGQGGSITNLAIGSFWQGYLSNTAWTAYFSPEACGSHGQGAVVVTSRNSIVSGDFQSSHGPNTHTAAGGFFHGPTNILTQMTGEVDRLLFGLTNIHERLSMISNAIVSGGTATDTLARAWLTCLTPTQEIHETKLGLLTASQQVDRTWLGVLTASQQVDRAWLTALTPTQEVHATWLGLLTASQQVDRTWLGVLTTSQQVDRAWLTALTPTQELHETKLGLLTSSGEVTRAMSSGATYTGQLAYAMASQITNSIPMSYINPVTGLVWLAQLYGTGTVTMCRRDLLGGSFVFDLVAQPSTAAQQVITLTITNGLLASTTNTLTAIDNRGVPPDFWYGINIVSTAGVPDNLRLNIGVVPK